MRNIYFARSNEALLDLDTEGAFKVFLERLPIATHLASKIVIVATRPHHHHVYIRLKRRHRFVDLSALQAYLGSDLRRELSNMSRIIAGASKPTLLIEYTKVRHWRRPDVVCSCAPKWKGKKLGNCRHLMAVRSHKPRYGFLSTRLKIVGVRDPYGHA